jgi:hypothetical protein
VAGGAGGGGGPHGVPGDMQPIGTSILGKLVTSIFVGSKQSMPALQITHAAVYQTVTIIAGCPEDGRIMCLRHVRAHVLDQGSADIFIDGMECT